MPDLVLQEAKRADAKKLEKFDLVIGEMSDVVGESVEFYFGFLANDTVVQSATLCLEIVLTQVGCR